MHVNRVLRNVRKFLRNLPVRQKLLVGYSVLFACVALAGNSTAYYLLRRDIDKRTAQNLETSTTAILNLIQTSARVSVRNYLRAAAEKNRDIVARFYDRFQAGEFTEKEAKEKAVEILLSQRVGKTGYMTCMDATTGRVAVHPVPEVIGTDLKVYWFGRQQLVQRYGYIEYEWKNPDDPEPRGKALYMTYFKPWNWIINASCYRDEFTELVTIDDFRPAVLAARFGETGYAYIIDGKGYFIIHPVLTGSGWDNRDAKGLYIAREICRRKQGRLTYSWKNPGEDEFREKLAIFNYLPDLDWIVVSTSYVEEFERPVRTLRNVFIVTTLFTLAMVIPLSWLISSSITNPIKNLMKHMQTGSAGDLSQRVAILSEDELGQLGEYFNDFMGKLEQSRQSLQEEILERQRAQDERAKIEAQLRQAQKMEAVGQLAGGVAHDFNNILTAIMGNAELLQADLPAGSRSLGNVREIIRACKRVTDLTQNLLAFGRKQQIELSQVNIHEIIDEVIGLLSHSIDRRIEIRRHLNATVPFVKGDPTQLQNALLNLGINARDAMPKGGVMTFETSEVGSDEVQLKKAEPTAKADRYLRISVCDTGSGMSEEIQERIFEPFFTTKKHGEGSGLGLAAVYGCVESHGGSIQVSSDLGKGSVFHVYLPVSKQGNEERVVEKVTGTVREGTGRILLVEDEDMVRDYAVRALASMGYETEICHDGHQAVDFYSQHADQIDLVILDLIMPRMNGLEALSRLKKINPEVKVVLCSGFADAQTPVDVIKKGAVGFLKKPFTMDDLNRTVAKYLRGPSNAD